MIGRLTGTLLAKQPPALLLDVAGVGGLTFGADPIAVATAFASEIRGKPVNAFSIRKTRKDHGIVRWIEGDLAPGSRVVVAGCSPRRKRNPTTMSATWTPVSSM